jgi:hypothetical protein
MIVGILMIGWVTSYFAKKRGRNPVTWFFIGAFFGLLGLLALFLMPAIKIQKEVLVPVVGHGQQQFTPEFTQFTPVVTDEFAGKEWFYLDEHLKHQGPFSQAALQQAAQANGTAGLSASDIDAEIVSARRARRRK